MMKRKPYVKSTLETLSIKEAMGIADVSRQTIYNWMDTKKFEFEQKPNRQVLINKNSFMKHVENIKKGDNEMKEQTEFGNMVNSIVEQYKLQLNEGENTFQDKKGELMVSVLNPIGRYEKWTLDAYAYRLVKEKLQHSLSETDITVDLDMDDLEETHQADFIIKGEEITVKTKLSAKELYLALKIATAKYAIKLAENFKIAVQKENCKAIAEYFNFDLFDEGMLEYAIESYLEINN